jgi:hypothetical protein
MPTGAFKSSTGFFLSRISKKNSRLQGCSSKKHPVSRNIPVQNIQSAGPVQHIQSARHMSVPLEFPACNGT